MLVAMPEATEIFIRMLSGQPLRSLLRADDAGGQLKAASRHAETAFIYGPADRWPATQRPEPAEPHGQPAAGWPTGPG